MDRKYIDYLLVIFIAITIGGVAATLGLIIPSIATPNPHRPDDSFTVHVIRKLDGALYIFPYAAIFSVLLTLTSSLFGYGAKNSVSGSLSGALRGGFRGGLIAGFAIVIAYVSLYLLALILLT